MLSLFSFVTLVRLFLSSSLDFPNTRFVPLEDDFGSLVVFSEGLHLGLASAMDRKLFTIMSCSIADVMSVRDNDAAVTVVGSLRRLSIRIAILV